MTFCSSATFTKLIAADTVLADIFSGITFKRIKRHGNKLVWNLLLIPHKWIVIGNSHNKFWTTQKAMKLK